MPSPTPSDPRPATNRGGHRPGAGAPRGNLNALKSGARSKQLKAFVTAMMTIPQTREMLDRLSRMQQHRRDQLADTLVYYAQIVRRPPPRRSIKENRRRQTPNDRFTSTFRKAIKTIKSHPEPACPEP
jgi:hypothetical protein